MGMIKVDKPTLNQGRFYQPSTLTVLIGAFFLGWVFVVPLNGPVLRILFQQASLANTVLMPVLLMVHMAGLILGAVAVSSLRQAWYIMFGVVIFSIACSGVLLTYFVHLWTVSALLMAFGAGLFLASWAYLLHRYVTSEGRFAAVADVLIGANVSMIVINVLTINWDVLSGELLALVLLLSSLWGLLRLQRVMDSAAASQDEDGADQETSVGGDKLPVQKTLIRPFVWLCVFITLIALNAGITQQVVMPVFRSFTLLTSAYWAMPYVVALLLLRNLPKRVNRAQMLYVALAMMGLGYLMFSRMEASAASFVLINSLILFAMGVFDLFWWSLMASFLDYAKRPSLILGLALVASTLGMLVGRVTGADMVRVPGTSPTDITFNAFLVIFISMAIMPLLNSELSRLFSQHIFLMNLGSYRRKAGEAKTLELQVNPLVALQESYQLTDREMEVVDLLTQGYTFKAISESLIISENTTKYHAKNIYQKMQVNNKMELIRLVGPLLQENQDTQSHPTRKG